MELKSVAFLIAAAGSLAGASAAFGSAVISVNFDGSAGQDYTNNASTGPSVNGPAGAVRASDFNNIAPSNSFAQSGSGITLVDNSNASAGTLAYQGPNKYNITPAGSATPTPAGTADDRALMNGYLDNFSQSGSFITVSGLGPEFTAGGYEILVYQDTDSAGSFGYSATDGVHTDTRYGEQLVANGGNYPLAGAYGYVGSNSLISAGSGTASNYVILTGFNASSFTLTGLAGKTGDGRTRINGFQIVAVPEPASIGVIGIGALSLLARRHRA